MIIIMIKIVTAITKKYNLGRFCKHHINIMHMIILQMMFCHLTILNIFSLLW